MQAVQILPSSSIHEKKTKITPDSELLFERLITICSNYDLNSALKDKHTHKPMLLFTDRRLEEGRLSYIRLKYILDKYQLDNVIPNIGNCKVLDGGILLHKIPWQVGCAFELIRSFYVYGWQHWFNLQWIT